MVRLLVIDYVYSMVGYCYLEFILNDFICPVNETFNLSHLQLIAVIQYLATLQNPIFGFSLSINSDIETPLYLHVVFESKILWC